MVVSGHFDALAASTTGKDPLVPIGKKAWWALEHVWMTRRGETSCPCILINNYYHIHTQCVILKYSGSIL